MAAEWLAQVPEDIRSEAMLQTIPDVPTLAKNYVNAQRLVGQDRIPAPQPTWGDKEWGDFYTKAGRPEKPDGYKFPEDIKLEEGLKFDDAKIAKAREFFHKEGFNPKQAASAMRFYAESLNEGVRGTRASEEASVAEATNKLRVEYGDRFGENVDIAKSVIREHGSPELVEFLNNSRLGDNPHLIRMLVKLGRGMSEDTARGEGTNRLIKDSTAARAEVDKLSGDKEFQQALNSREHPGHKQALERWMHVFSAAFPGKEPGQ